jgi:predicted anti-sigma-YlaC factor YlaD
MHGFIRDKLEDLLRGERRKEDPGIEKHLSSCAECASELESMRTQGVLLRSLRTAEEVEPSAGFYARVIQRIEDSARDSIWAVFIDSPFGKRLAYASFMLTVLLGSYVIAQEARDGHLRGPNIVAQEFYTAPVVGSQAQQRDAVLMNFASDQGFAQ